MALSKTCQTCSLVRFNNEKIFDLKENFDSKKTENKFEAAVVEIDIAKERKKVFIQQFKDTV